MPTRHAALTLKIKSTNAAPRCQFHFNIDQRTPDHQLRLNVGRMPGSILELRLLGNKTSVSTF